MCRAYNVANREEGKWHYQDFIKPFRARQPDYQRRWRLSVRLREIREKMRAVAGALPAGLRALLERCGLVAASPAGTAQTGVLSGDLLDKAQAALGGALLALEQLGASVAALGALGL